MGLFGKSFEEKVAEALDALRGRGIGVDMLAANVDGKVVTLTGVAKNKEAKTRLMTEFNALVETENTINQIKVSEPAPAPAAAVPAAAPVVEAVPVAPVAPIAPVVRMHEVVRGDTLGAIAKTYYGKASLYTKIFEANRDILKDPDKIQVGQKLRIPE